MLSVKNHKALQILFKKLLIIGIAGVFISSHFCQAAIIFQNDTFATLDSNNILIDSDGTASGTVLIQFGSIMNQSIGWNSTNTRFEISNNLRVQGNQSTIGQTFIANDHAVANSPGILNLGLNSSSWENLAWNTSTLRFDLSDDLNLTGGLEVSGNVDLNLNQLVETRAENLGSSPTCNAGSRGRYYHNTTDNLLYLCNGTIFYPLSRKHFHNSNPITGIITATISGTVSGATTTVYLTDNGLVSGNKLFTTVYHISTSASVIQTSPEGPVPAGYSYDAGTGAVVVKFMESAGVLLGGQGLENEENGTPFTILAIGI